MRKKSEKRLWQFYTVKNNVETVHHTGEYRKPSRTKVWREINRLLNKDKWGYRLMKLDNGEVVEA